MHSVGRKQVKRLIAEPIDFALMMEDSDLEDVIAVFVTVLNKRKTDRFINAKQTHLMQINLPFHVHK